MKNRIYIINFFFLIFASLLLFRGAWLQFFPSEKLVSAKKRLFEKVVTIRPRRGTIYDRHGRELALSISSFSAFVDPSLIQNDSQVARQISKITRLPQKQILKKIRDKKDKFNWIKRHISEKEKKALQDLSIHGLGFIEESKRIYPGGKLLSQVLGFTGFEGHGLEGLELFYDHILRGSEQKIITPRDARGRPLLIEELAFVDKSRGSDIYLTIDSDLQFVLEQQLHQAVEKFKALSAMGIILHPETFEILALAHSPNFDPNEPLKFESSLYRNRIVADVFEPGSTFKTFIVATALKEKIPPHKIYKTQKGQLKIGKHIIQEAESDHQYDQLSISDILTVSSNVGAALLALDLKDFVLYPSLQEFGFGEKMEVQFPLEGRGVLKEPPWSSILTSNVGFGHGISTTPLQMVSAYAAIANGGFLKQPYILKSIVDLSGVENQSPSAKVIRKILTKKQSEALTSMLIQVTSEEGTGFKARVKGFLTAGKTGTAQKSDVNKRGYVQGKYISSFVGFVPADRPQFVIYVAVDEPSTKFYGSTVAAPVFSTVGAYAVRRASLTPSFIEEKSILPDQEERSQNFQQVLKQDFSTETIPNFVGMSLRQAFRKAKEMDLKIKIKGSGRVQSSIPFSGEDLPKNRQVLLILSDPS